MSFVVSSVVESSVNKIATTEINSKLNISQFLDSETSWNFTHRLKCENKYISDKIFDGITLLLFIIYSFIKFYVLVNLTKSFHGSTWLYCNWSIGHTTNTVNVQWDLNVYILSLNTWQRTTFGKSCFTQQNIKERCKKD